MNAPVLLAQLAGSPAQTPSSPKNLKLEKPQNGQAVTVHLDGNTKLDFADVASEKLTFVRVGEKLIILFDNQSTVTVDPVFDSMGKPLTDLAFDMGSDRTLTGDQFAQTFPITTDQSVLPAAGGATGPTGGANFGDASVGALGASGARLALLAGEDGAGGFSTLDDATPNPAPIPGGVVPVTLNEDGFAEGNLGGTGDTGGTATSVTGSLNVDFGTDFVNRSFAFSLNQPTLAGLTSDGQTVQLAFTTVNGQPVMIGYVGGDFTVAANQVFTVSLDASSLQGSYTFTLLRPLDHPIHGTEDTINLSINVIATDGSGDTAPVTISIGINDDTPVIGTPTEAVLTDPLSGNPATQTGSLGISWGADRYNDHVDGGVSATTGGTGDRSVIFGAASVAVTDASGNGIASLTSNGETVHYVLLNNGTALVAYTGDTVPSALPGSEVASNIVFVVTLSDASSTGSYTITQYQPLDHVSGDQTLASLNLTFQYTATDSDGDSVSGTVTTVVTDTVPTLGESVAAHTVGEDGLPGANVSGPEGGFDAANNASVTGALNINWNADSDIRHDGDTYGRTLSFLTSGETPTAIAGGSAAISNLNLTITGEAGTALMSGGVALRYVVTANADGGETLTAYKGTPGEGSAVFTLVLDPTSTNGSYTFTLLGELDHGAESNSIGLTFTVQAADADGDTINTSFVVNVEDDVPVAHAVTASRVLDDEAQSVFTPTNSGGTGDVSPDYNSVQGTAGTLFSAGADGVKSVTISGGAFQVIYKDASGFALTESVTWGVGVQGTDGTTTFTATSAHYTGADGTSVAATLVIGADGSYTYTASAPVVQATSGTAEENATIKINFIVTDGDGDTASGSLSVDVNDDTPVAHSVTASRVLDDEAQTVFTPTNPGTGFLNLGDVSPNYNSVTGAAGSLFTAGADGVKSVTLAGPAFSVIYKDAQGFAQQESVTWGAGVPDGSGHTTFTATSAHYAGATGAATLVVGVDGSYTLTLFAPLVQDIQLAGIEENKTLSFGVTVTDGDGDQATATLRVSVNDDTPVPIASIVVASYALDDEAQTLFPGNNTPDDHVANSKLVTGAAGTLFSMGADGLGSLSVALPSFSVIYSDGGFAKTESVDWSAGARSANGTTTFTATGHTSGDTVGILIIKADGSYSFELDAPVVQSGNGEDNKVLSFLYTVTDGDGDAAGGSLFVTVNDDVPVAHVVTAATVLDDEAQTVFAGNDTPADGVPNTNVAHGDAGALFSAGADGVRSVTISGGAFQVVYKDASGFALTESVTWGVGVQGTDGTTTFTATSVHYTGADGTSVAATLVIGADGSYTYTAFAPVVQATSGTAEENATIKINFIVTDGDGDTASGSLSVNVNDDTPVAHSVTASRVLDDEAQTVFTPTNPGTGFLNLGDVSPNYNSVTGAAGSLFTAGADGVKSVALAGPAFSVIYKDAQGFAQQEGVTWGAGVPDGSGHTTFTATSAHYAGATGAATLVVGVDGSYTLTLFAPLVQDIQLAGIEENKTLSFGVTVTDGDGDQATATLRVDVNDDTPVPVASIVFAAQVMDDEAQTLFTPVNNGGIGDVSPNVGVVSGGAGALFSMGADGLGSLSVGLPGFNAIYKADGFAKVESVDWSNGVRSAGGVTTFTATGHVSGNTVGVLVIKADGSYSFTLSEPIAHDLQLPGIEDTKTLTFTYTAKDGDGDAAIGSLSVSVNDDVPTAKVVTASTVLDDEKQTVFAGNAGGTGDVADNNVAHGDAGALFSAGADGVKSVTISGGAFQVVYKDASGVAHTESVTWGAGVPDTNGNTTFTATSVHYATAATLVIGADGSYTYTASAPVVQPTATSGANPVEENATIKINFTVTDGDGDTASGSLSVNVNDDTPVASWLGAQPVTESTDLAGVFIPSVSTGTLAFSAGADGGQITSVVYRFGNSIMEQAEGAGDPQSFPALTSHGVAVVIGTVTDGTAFGGQGSITLTGTAGGQVVFTLVVNQTTGAYIYTLSGPIDHPDIDQSGADDALTMVFDFQVTDGDGDKTAAFNEGMLQIDIRDDAPTIASSTLGANLITNGQFLDNTGFGPPQPGWGGETATGSILGWTISGVGLERNPSGWYVADPVNGGRVVDLDASPGNVTIAQTLTNLTAGESYTLSFDAAKPLGFDATAQVWWNGVLVGTVNPSASGFQQFSFTFTAVAGPNTLEFREVGVADNGGTFLANVQLHTTASIVDEDALHGGNAGGQGDTPGTAVATGSLGIHWGADSSDTSDSGGVQDGAGAANNVSENVAALTGRAVYFTDSDSVTAGLQPAISAIAGATAITLSSQGQAVHYQVLENGTTAVGYTGTFVAGNTSNWVFKASLSDEANGSYTFTLLKPIDHPVAGSEDNVTLSFGYTARDFDGDTVSGSFNITINDDTPVAIAPADVVTVSETGLPLVDAHTGFLNVSWGADNGAGKHLNFAKDSNGAVIGPVLHSNGVLLAYRVEPESPGSDNERLIAYRVDDASKSAVFSITLYEPGNPYYTVALFGPLDHAPGSDPLTLGFTVIATDADGDSLNVPISVVVVDSVPVATGAAQTVTVSEVGLPLVDAHTGFLNVNWGADKGAAKHLNFAKDGNGAVIGPVLHSDGVLLAYRVEPESPGSDNERLVAYRVDDPSHSAVFSITLYEPGNPYYTVALFGPLDHAPGSDPLTLGFTVIATDADGDSLNVPISVVIVDSVPTAGPGDAGAVSEHLLTTQTGFGQGFENATDSTTAGFVDGGDYGQLVIKASGTDGIVTKTHSGNYALVTQTADESAPFTRFGGYDSTFDGGFKASVDIYLDPNKIGSGEGFDYSVAVNKTDGSFLRDFIFHVGEDSQGNLYISAGNNTGFDPLTDAQWAATVIKSNIPASAAGWYTFTQTFHDDGTGHLAVDMVVRDASGAVVFTQTLASGDLISDTGGHRYGWFTNVDVANGIAIDNVSLTQHDDSTSATSVAGSLHINAGADGLGSLTFGGIVDGSTVTDSSNQIVTSGHQAVRYHVVDSHTLEGVTAGGQVIFTVTLDPATGGYNFVLAHQIDHPAPGTDSVALQFGYVVTDGDGDIATSTFTVTVGDDVPVIAGTATSVNLLTDGNFVSGSFPHVESWGGWATDGTGWKITGTAPGQTGVQLERVVDGYNGMHSSDGSPMVDLEASPGDIAISQTVNGLTVGQHYTLSFEIGAANPSSAGLEVYWNGGLVHTYQPTGSMTLQMLDLTAIAGANIVSFKEIGSAGDNTGTYLANVSLVQASASLPVFHADINEDGASVVTLVNGVDFHFGADGPGAVAFDTAHATMSTPIGTTLGMPTLSYDPVTGKLTVDPGWGFNGLSEGEIATLSVPFTVTDSDGDSKSGVYQFTIHGSNDAVGTSPGFPDSGTMTEYGETDPRAGSTTDRTYFDDPSGNAGYNGGGFWIYDDQGDTHTVTVTPPATGYLGHLTAVVSEETVNDGAGFVNWQYHVTDADLNPLAQGETKVEKFTITVDDGHGSTTSRVITVTLVGTNDSPVITTTSASAVVFENGDLDAVGADHAANFRFEPNVNVDTYLQNHLVTGVDMATLLTQVQAAIGPQASLADAIATVWDYIDDNGGYYNNLLNEMSARLGIEYARYLEAGGKPLLDVLAKYTADNNNNGTPDRAQSLHDNLLGNLHGPSLIDKMLGAGQGSNPNPIPSVYNALLTLLSGYGLSDLTSRPIYSGDEGAANSALAWDQQHGLVPVAGGQLAATDVDHGAVLTWSGDLTTAYGSFVITPGGAWTYTLNQTGEANKLGEGETVTETFTATVTDEHGATDTIPVTITIKGANDAPVITSNAAAAQGAVSEAGDLAQIHEAGIGGPLQVAASLASNSVVTASLATLDGHVIGNPLPPLPSVADVHAAIITIATVSDMATAIAVVWQHLDAIYGSVGPDKVNVNAAFTALGLEYADYLQAGGKPLVDVVAKFTADGADADTLPDRLQSLHENLLSNVTDYALHQRYDAAGLYTQMHDLVVSHDASLLTRTPVPVTGTASDPAGLADQAHAWDMAHGYATHVSGQLTASDVDHGAVLQWSISGQSPYGTMAIEATTGKWTYTLDDALLETQALAQGESVQQVFTATVTDEHGATGKQTVTVTITGTNDAPVITSGAASVTVFEAGGLNNVVTADVAADHRFEPARNVDGVAEHAIDASVNTAADMKAVVASVQAALGGGATVADAIAAVWDYLDDTRLLINGTNEAYYAPALNKAGVLLGLVYADYLQHDGRPLLDVVVKYTPDNDLSGAPDRVQSLHDNLLGAVDTPSINDKFSTNPTLLADLKVQIADAGLTDRPIFSGNEGVANNALAWDQAHGFLPVASGQMTATDVDHGAVLTWSINGPATYGNMAIDPVTGAWSYTLDNGNAATQALAEGETKTQVFTATVTDEHGATANQTVTVTIHGTNDAPVIHVDAGDSDAKFLTETNAGLTASGTLSVTDVDVSDTVTASVLSVSASGSGIEGLFTSAQLLSFFSLGASQVKAAGSTTGDIAWTFNSQSEAFDFLPNGWESKISYTIQVSDGHGGMDTHVVEIKIHGTNDAPVVDLNGAATEGNDIAVTAVEQLPQWILSSAAITDVDSTTMHSMKVTLTMQPDGLGVEGLSFNTSATNALTTAGLTYGYDATTGVLTVTGDASTATYQTIMRGVVYQYTGDAPSTGDRIVTVVVNDGLDNSITHTATVHVQPVNDPPVLGGTLTATVVEGQAHTLTAAELGYTDPDNGPSGVVFHVSDVQHGTITNGGAPATSFTAAELANGLISFTHDGSEGPQATFSVTVEDGNQDNSPPTPGLFTFTVSPVDDGVAPLTIVDITQTATAPKVGDVLNATLGADPDGAASSIVYHWLRDGTEVSSGTSSSYTLGSSDAGHAISAYATYIDGQGFHDTTATTAQTAAVISANNAPVFTTSDVAGGVFEDAGTTQGATLIQNGNFENYDYSNSFAANWTPSSSGGFWSPAWFANHTSSGFLGMAEYGGATSFSQGGIATTAGTSYLIDFWVYQYSSAATLYVQWDGNTVASVNDSSSSWKEYRIVVTGTGSDTLTFLADDPSYAGMRMDDVSVTKFTANATQTASGVLHFTDEAADTHTASFTQGSALNSAGTAYLGTFSLDSVTETSGTDSLGWHFSADNSALQSLAAGQAVTQTYEVAVTDSHANASIKEVTVTLTGVNDAPVFGSGTAMGVVAQSTLPTGNLLTNGGFDTGNTSGWTIVKGADTYAQADSSFHFASGNTWNFDVYGTNPATKEGIATISQSISTVAGQHYLLAFDYAGAYGLSPDSTLKVSWAGTQIISLSGIQNTNTDSGVGSPYTYLVTGDGNSDVLTFAFDAKNQDLRIDSVSLVRAEVAQGSISFSDVDLTDNAHTVSVASKTANPYGYMTAIVDEVTHQVNWTFVVKDSEIAGLAVGQSVNETYTLTLDDHHGGVVTKDVTVTVSGLPGAPVITGITAASDSGTIGDNITNDTTPSFVGTAQAFSTVTVRDGATVLGTTTADATGAWIFTPDAAHALSSTTHTAITATATDTAGHVSAASANYTLTIDTTAPSSLAGTSLDLATASDSGANTSDNITKVTTPTITVGHLNGTPMSIGDVIQIIDTDHGNAVVGSYTVQASDLNGSSQWNSAGGGAGGVKDIILTTLADGAHNFTVQLVDKAGNPGIPGGTLTVTEDTTAPSAPSISVIDDVGNIQSTNLADGAFSDDTQLVVHVSLTGTGAVAGDTVQLSNNTTALGSAVTLTSANIIAGFVDITTPTLTNGASYNLRAAITDVAGNVGALSTSGAHDVTIDTTKPTVSSEAITGATGIQNGYLNAGDVVSITVNMSEVVTVTGTPQLSLTIGSTPVLATYASGSGSSALVFTYTILATQNDSNGISINNNGLSLNGGTIRDAAGNDATLAAASVTDNGNYKVDTVAPVITASDFNNLISSGGTFSVNVTDTGGSGVVSVNVVDSSGGSFSALNSSGSTWSRSSQTSHNGHNLTVTATDAAGNVATATGKGPAGTSGEAINLALTAPTDHVGLVSLTIAGLAAGWTLSEGTHNADGTWSILTSDPSSLSVTSPDGYTGALVLQVTETWTNADGSTGTVYVADNVEAYAKGAPIFAWSGDDTLTASSGADTLVFANKIGTDVVHHFDTVHDKIDLIGFAGFSSFADVQAHLGTDAAGNAIITLGDGQTITLNGVSAASLSADDFLFNETPVTHNAGDIVLSDGSLMPFSGVLDNTGSIHLASTGGETAFEIVQRGLTLLGGGTVTLSDNSSNVIFGSADDVTLTNVDNVIAGAGHLGDGHLTLVNEGTINATGSNALVIDTGDNAVINAGILEATGTGGLDVHSDVVNDGLLWANGANLDIDGNVSGSGSALLSGHASLELGGSFSEQITFDSSAEGTLVIDHSADFHGMLSGFDGNDTIDLADILGSTASMNYTENAQGTGGVLTVTDGAHTANIAFAGQYSTADFHISSDVSNHVLVQLESQARQLTNAA